MKVLVWVFFLHLRIVYFIFKLFPSKNKVLFLSRLSNDVSIDYKLLSNALKEDGINVVLLPMKMNNYIKYYFHMYKEMYHLATSKVCIVDSYIPTVSMLKHKKGYEVIQIWHALGAIKKFGLQNLKLDNGRNKTLSEAMKMHQNYTKILSSSDKTDEYFGSAFGYKKDVFVRIGLPRIDYLQKEKNNIKKRIYKTYPSLKNKKTILYAPTFRKDKQDRTEDILNIIDYDKYNVIIKSHPLHKLNINNDKIYTCKEFKAMELLTVADILITDYSAISFEACVLDKKVFFYTYDYEEYLKKTGLNIELIKDFPSLTHDNINKLKEAIKKEYPKKEYELFKSTYLNVGKNNIKTINDEINVMLNKKCK